MTMFEKPTGGDFRNPSVGYVSSGPVSPQRAYWGTAAVPPPEFVIADAINQLSKRIQALEARFETLDMPETEEQP